MCVSIILKQFYLLETVLITLLVHILHDNTAFAQLRLPQIGNVCPAYSVPNFRMSLPFENCESAAKNSLLRRHPDQDKNTAEVLQTYGYPFETHSVTTTDNYILTVYRIIGSPNRVSGRERKRFPIYLQHGILAASDTWNFQQGSRNLRNNDSLININGSFKLADAGYEVWLGNSRGTSYSLGHKVYNADRDLAYWDFSFHEMGVYDVPAVTERILTESGAAKIIYIGHSMGATQYFVSLSEIPAMNDKIEAAFLLAPIAYIGHTYHISRTLAPLISPLPMPTVLNAAFKGRLELNKLPERFNISTGDFCVPTAAQCGLCDNAVFLFSGYNAPQMNVTELPNIVAKILNSVSVKTFVHYAQLVQNCEFRQYSYGPVQNLVRYGSLLNPPNYNLNNIRAPAYFYYAERDNLATPADVMKTAGALRSGVLKGMYKVPDDLFNHQDFILAKDADILVYNQILNTIESF